MAGPLLRGGEIAMAACDAIEEDNPDKEILIEDHRTYLRVEAEGGLIIRRETMEAILGRPFNMRRLREAAASRSARQGQWGRFRPHGTRLGSAGAGRFLCGLVCAV